ncbi:hypothetical protein AB7849_09405 [Rhodanobacter sp. 115]|uniref:hypothetical protein n=1 Tax=Rhodanobacter sp. FW021-MT20 TaxID=1162282 RepID=UPI0034E4842D
MTSSPILFTHACLSDSEVRTAIAQLPSPDVDAGKERKLEIFALLVIGIGATLFFIGLACSDMPVIGLLLVFLAFACLVGFVGIRNARANVLARRQRRIDARTVYSPLDNHGLAALNELANRFPAIKEACMEWLSDGKTIRERDLAACRVYALKEGPRVERELALEQLSLPTGLRPSAAQTR